MEFKVYYSLSDGCTSKIHPLTNKVSFFLMSNINSLVDDELTFPVKFILRDVWSDIASFNLKSPKDFEMVKSIAMTYALLWESWNID